MRDTTTVVDDAPDVQTEGPTSEGAAGFPRAVLLLVRNAFDIFTGMPAPRVLWGPATYAALFALIAIWAALLRATWAAWGDLTVDSGHEMYVPAMLAAGKMLYRDIWFMYPPAAPYFNSYLFHIFGVHLNVLYWAGSLAALGSAIFLFLTGMSLGSWLIGWTAGTVVLIQAFGPSLFCFPLPYGFSAVYGCFTACLFLWLIVEAIRSGRITWMFGAGTAAAVALLFKLEFGVACYSTLVLLIVADSWRQRSWKPLWAGALTSLPGVMACVLVARWMISIAGADFITQENFQSWPTSYFMRVYGKAWLEHTGFSLSRNALFGAFGRISLFTATVIGIRLLLRRTRSKKGSAIWIASGIAAFECIPIAVFFRGAVFLTEHALLASLLCISIFLAVAIAFRFFRPQNRNWRIGLPVAAGLGLAAVVCLTPIVALRGALLLRRIFFPEDMVAIVALAAIACWWFLIRRRGLSCDNVAICALFTMPVLLAFRIMMRMECEGYPIYYNGPVILAFLFIASRLLLAEPGLHCTIKLRAELFACCFCLIWTSTHAQSLVSGRMNLVPLATERGVVLTQQDLAMDYRQAIAFMKEKAAAGKFVLSIPEDTSLYFLSGTICPIRVTQFTPGVLVPGKMTQETVSEIERKNVQYLLWSNRTSAEYGVPLFGKDYDAAFAGYLTSHYRPVGPLIRNSENGWAAMVWERIGHENETR